MHSCLGWVASVSPSRCTLHPAQCPESDLCAVSQRVPLYSGLQLGVVKGRHPQEIRRKEQSEVGVFIPMTLSLQVSWVGCVPQAKAITSSKRADSKFQPPLFPPPFRMVTALLLPPLPPSPISPRHGYTLFLILPYILSFHNCFSVKKPP